jgi:hypothetical protein
MAEMGACLPEDPVGGTLAPPSSWTLLNADSLQGTFSSGPETPDLSSDEKDSAEHLLTAAIPSVPPETVPVRPLALNLIFQFDPHQVAAASEEHHTYEQASPVLKSSMTEEQQRIEETGATPSLNGAPAGQLAFVARVSEQDSPPAESPAIKTRLEPSRPGSPRPKLEDNVSHESDESGEPAEALVEEFTANKLEMKEHHWNGALPAPGSMRSEAPPQPASAQPVYATAKLVEVEAAQDERPAELVREVSLAIDGEDGRVRLRMETHSGELRAWVSGSNGETVERVRAELPELARSLRDSGFKSELWTPSSIKQVDAAPELHAGSEHGQRSFGADDHQHHDGSRRRRPQPEWFEQIEEG